jgi:D-glycero-D-manno-heptose 1,7-bisphosphate phosphatase
MRRAVFLDRDGTLNVRPPVHEYVTNIGDFVWIEGAREAVALLARADYLITIVSNQRGVARGLVSLAAIRQIENRIERDLAAVGARVVAFRYCFHASEDACSCRKPRPGMLLDLAAELDLDLERSWTIGDSDTDVLAGQAAGTRTALVGSSPRRSQPDLAAASLLDAVAGIVQDPDGRAWPAQGTAAGLSTSPLLSNSETSS